MNNKNICLIFLFSAIFANCIVFSQSKTDSVNSAIIISVKTGYHFSDKIDDAEDGFPGGIFYDISGEFHIGKGWFMGINYDYWKGEDELTDFRYGHVKREVKGEDFSFIFRYRLFLKSAALNVGVGLGSSTYRNYIIFTNNTNKSRTTMFNVNARFGVEYFITKNIIISSEVSALSADEFKFDMGGGQGRKNSLIQLKAGIGYILRK